MKFKILGQITERFKIPEDGKKNCFATITATNPENGNTITCKMSKLSSPQSGRLL